MKYDLTVSVAGSAADDVRARLAALAGESRVAFEAVNGDVREASARTQLCVGAGELSGSDAEAADAIVPAGASYEEVGQLWEERIEPFARNLAAGKRAPRRRHAVLFPYHPQWAIQAERLLARLRRAVPGALRFDHIGSTSVPGMHAKDLVDLQLVVPTLDDAAKTAELCRAAGFVSAGLIYDINRYGEQVPEYCACDADPGRPVNVHIRPLDSVVWRETLLLRDWLRAHEHGRAEYVELKQRLAATPGGNVDQYSDDKMPWIASAIARAEDWAAATGWNP